MAKGKIPVTGIINLENTGEDHWRLFSNGVLGDNFEISGITNQGKNSETKIRIRIFVLNIIPPERQWVQMKSKFDTNLEGFSLGLSRISDSVTELIYRSSWIIIGQINGKEESPIIIVHFPLIDKSFYSLKLIGEDDNNFLPHLN